MSATAFPVCLRFAWIAVVCAVAIVAMAGSARAQSEQAAFFVTDAINAGLGPVPTEVERGTPRSTMQTLLRAAARGDWDAAAHLLDLSDIPMADQAVIGPRYAEMLHEVIERRAILDWSLLRNRPDALDSAAADQDPLGGQSRRALLLRELDLDPVPATISLFRLRPGDESTPMVWVFSRQTVADIPALHARYGPSRFEQWLPQPLRMEAFWGLMWWELIGLPLLLVAAVAVGWATWWIMTAAQNRTRNLAREIIDTARMPAIIASVTAVLGWSTTSLFVFSSTLSTWITPLVAIGYTTAILMLVMNGMAAILQAIIGPDDTDLTAREMADQRRAATRLSALRQLLTVTVFIVGAGVVLSSADIFRSLGLSLLASAGALTLVIGFAAREVLGNIMASLQIALNQSARVGDRIMWHDNLCYVEKINFTFVLLRNWDQTRVVVPVSEFISETFTNWTIEDPAMLRILKFKLSPEADIPALREAFNAILEDMSAGEFGDDMGDLEDAGVNVVGQDALGVDVWFSVPCLDPATQWGISCEARERLIAAALGIADRSGRAVFPDGAAMEAAA